MQATVDFGLHFPVSPTPLSADVELTSTLEGNESPRWILVTSISGQENEVYGSSGHARPSRLLRAVDRNGRCPHALVIAVSKAVRWIVCQ